MSHIYAYNWGSESSRDLGRELGFLRVRHENSRFRGGENKTVINWGSSNLPEEISRCRVINSPEAVTLCSNKLNFFRHINNATTPDFTTDREEALSWLREDTIVFGRTRLQGRNGDGIVVIENEDEFVDAPLYVKYVPKRNEYRVHVFNGRVIDVQRKALREGHETNDNTFRIRNTANGFIFARNEDHVHNPLVEEEALTAFNEIEGLVFGAFDIIYNEYRNKAYVLEVNTAPGLSGTTLQNYVEAFREYLG